MHSTCLTQAQLYVTPKIGYVNAMPLFCKRHLALSSPLGHLNGDNANSPPDAQKARWHPQFNSYNRRTQSLTRPTTHAAIWTSHNSISSSYSQAYSPRVSQHQKQTQYSMLQIKPISKNTFRPSPSIFFITLPLFTLKLSEETTQRNHIYVTPSSSLNTNNTSLLLTTKNSG